MHLGHNIHCCRSRPTASRNRTAGAPSHIVPPNRHLLGCMRDSLIKCRSGHGRRHKPNYSTYLQHNMCYSILLCTADNLTTSMVIPRGLRRSVSNFKGFKYKSIWNSSVYGSPTRSHSRLASSASSFYFTCPIGHSSTPSNQPADRPTNHPQHANVEISMDIQTTIHHVYWVLSPKTSTYLLTTGY